LRPQPPFDLEGLGRASAEDNVSLERDSKAADERSGSHGRFAFVGPRIWYAFAVAWVCLVFLLYASQFLLPGLSDGG
jgi:hypothetical protein